MVSRRFATTFRRVCVALISGAVVCVAGFAQNAPPPPAPGTDPLASQVVTPTPPSPFTAFPIPQPPAVPATTSMNLAPHAGTSIPSTLVAGRTDGAFKVSNSGAANYSIPLWAPPGVGALQLSLTLNYNSRSPDGVTGVGWSLSGTSAITRCNRTWAQDGYAQGITLTTSDRLCLDGNQLKVVTGAPATPAQGGTTFATEIETFSQITTAGSSGSAPTSLTVTTKNGLIYDYGLTADSQIMGGPTGPIRAWALSQIRDRVGNKIKFSYYNDAGSGSSYTNGSYRIKEIDYPYTASGQGPFYSMTFRYGARASGTNIPSGYIAGALVQEPNQLNTISIQDYGSSTPTKTYYLTYATNSVSSRLQLQQVQECSASNCFPATSIAYQSGSRGWSSVQTTAITTPNQFSTQIPVDLNGDGLTDLLYSVENPPSVPKQWNVSFSSGAGYQSPINTTIPDTALHVITGNFSGAASNQILTTDNACTVRIYTYNGTSFTGANAGTICGADILAADWDGDGLADLVTLTSTSVYVTKNTTQPGGPVTFTSTPTLVYTIPNGWSIAPWAHNSLVADFNADGRADVLLSARTSLNTSAFIVLTSNGFTQAPIATVLPLGTQTGGVALGDWNGDGCTDILFETTIYVSQCNGQFTTIPTGVQSAFNYVVAVDWDGDGLSDLMYVGSDGLWHVQRSTGNGIASPITVGNLGGWAAVFAGDKDGDGLSDLLIMAPSGVGNGLQLNYATHAGASAPPDFAISFTDAFAIKQSPTYAPISQSTYIKCTGSPQTCPLATFPEQDYQGPLYVVNQFTASDGTGSTYQDQFQYGGARVNVQGRGFEGFINRRTYDSRNGLYTYDYLAQQFPYTGMFYQLWVNTGSHLVSSWVATPQKQTVTGLGGYETRYFPYLQQAILTEAEVGGPLNGTTTKTTTTQYTYGDGFGNPTQIQTSVVDNDSTSPFLGLTWETTLNASYLNDTSAYCLGLPSGTLTIQSVVPGQTTDTRTYQYAVDSNHSLCRIQQEVIEPNTPALMTTRTLGFDGCGNANSISVVGHKPDGTVMPTLTTSANYSYLTSRCQLAELVTNAAGEQTIITSNYDFGVPTQMTDPNGVPISWLYDDFGRRAKETRPDGTYTTWQYTTYENPNADLKYLVYEYEYGSDNKNYWSQILFYDGMMRLRYQEGYNALGSWDAQQILMYDSLGRVIYQNNPTGGASGGGNGHWSIPVYDVLNRPQQALLYQTANGPVDRTLQWTYSGRTTTVTDPLNHNTSFITDVAGRLRKVVDPSPGGTTSYDYDVFGNLNKVTDAAGVASSATYNRRGFKTQMVDADAGKWNFQGDSLNELESWTDAKNQSFTASYDPLGRLATRSEAEGTSTWTWGNTKSLHNIDQLQSVSGLGYSESLYYDGLGRLQTRVIVTDQPYQYDYAYNSATGLGSLDTITYPASTAPAGTTATRFKIQYGYGYGFTTQISDVTQGTSTPLWTLKGANGGYNTPTSETLGANIVSVNTGYKPWTSEVTSLQSGVSGSTNNRQNLAYQWDTNGNLQQRSDNIQSLTEVFTPDALGRVQSSTVNGNQNLTVTYDPSGSGNIQSRSDVGTYTYGDSQHPHGVTAAGTYTFTYDKNGNVATRNGSTQTWASFNLPTTLNSSSYSSSFAYGPDHQRYVQAATYSNGTENTYYVGGLLEKVSGSASTATHWRHYVPTPSGLTVIVSRNSDTTTSTTFALGDHLGSSDALLDGAGNLLVEESFGAYGKRRASNWSSGPPSSSDYTAISHATRRGFTFHEELDNIGLIHMNGRVYDPNVGRFLSVDSMIGSLADSQAVNPYSYVGNRPLTSTDPTGNLEQVVVTADQFVPEPPAVELVPAGDFLRSRLVSELPQPPTARATNSAQSGFGQDACATTSARCGDDPTAILNGPIIPPEAVGFSLPGAGEIVAVDLTPDIMSDGSAYDELITISASRSSLPRGLLLGPGSLRLYDHLSLVSHGYYEVPGVVALPSGGVLHTGTLFRVSAFLDSHAAEAYGNAMGFLNDLGSGLMLAAAPLGIATGPFAAARGFRSFSAFKNAMGRAGSSMNWHHIVEQTPGNLARFGPQSIHNTENLVRLDAALHGRISAYYSSIQPQVTGSTTLTIRQWLSTQSFEAQEAFGQRVLSMFGGQ
jgi:RHS repeat-associated protein